MEGDLRISEEGESGSSTRQDTEQKIKKDTWKYKYHAAAIFLQQGENNEKFSTHPVSETTMPAYVLAHNSALNAAYFAVCLVLLALAFVEKPAVFPHLEDYRWAHSVVELLCLSAIGFEMGVKVRWLGPRQFVRHRRSVAKCVVLALMVAESLAVLARNRTHFRISRALRPIFLIDSHFAYDVRRFIRQIVQSVPAVLDIIALLFMVMGVFSVLAFSFFWDIEPDYFGTPAKSFVSMFILLTSANTPDVMMKAYGSNRWNSLFFIIYTMIEFYFIINLLLAVVYDRFASNEKSKFREVFLHKREGALKALDLLSETHRNEPKEVNIERFIGMLHFLDMFSSKSNLRDMYLCFLALNKSGSGRISEEEFYAIYDVVHLKWRKESRDGCCRFPSALRRPEAALEWVVGSRGFVGASYALSALCGLYYSVQVFFIRGVYSDYNQIYFVASLVFCSLFTLEALLKLVALGPLNYWSSGWNKYDIGVTILALIGVVLNDIDHSITHLIVLRFLSLFKLLRVKASFRNIFNTISILIPRFISVGIVLMIIDYFFAIIGMEIFGPLTNDLKNCCNGTLVAEKYVFDTANNVTFGYYLNSFENMLVSAVTLWDLMVVNNWFIIMEGFTSVSGTDWTRLFFMLYFIVMMVVLNIVVAFILEGFIFRIQVSRAAVNEDDPDNTEELVQVAKKELDLLCGQGYDVISDAQLSSARDSSDEMVEFRGFRFKDRGDFSHQLYSAEMEEWAEEQRASLGFVRSDSPVNVAAASSSSSSDGDETEPEGRLSD